MKNIRLEKEIDFLKEEFRSYFLLLTALLSGEATLIYAVVSGSKPLYVLFLAIFGVIFIGMIFSKLSFIKSDIFKKLDKMEGK